MLIEYHLEVLFMILQCVAVDEYIIEVDVYTMSNVISKDHCHWTLKHCRGIAIPLLHDLTDKGPGRP